jgi:hypothetical protein
MTKTPQAHHPLTHQAPEPKKDKPPVLASGTVPPKPPAPKLQVRQHNREAIREVALKVEALEALEGLSVSERGVVIHAVRALRDLLN